MSKKKQANNSQKNITLPEKPTGKLSISRKALSIFFPTEIAKIDRPTLDREFVSLPTVERVTEAVKYNIFSFEYSISPNGGLRQWIKINAGLLFLLGAPALVFIILTSLFVEGMANVVEMLRAMVSSTELMLEMALNIVKTLGLIAAVGTCIYFANKAYRNSGKSNRKKSMRDYIDITPGKKR